MHIKDEYIRQEAQRVNRANKRDINKTIAKLKEDKSLHTAIRKRLGDTGWGWALAHVLPFVGFYYACSRRTIKPFLFCYPITVFLSLLFRSIFPSDYSTFTLDQLFILSLQPLLAKEGINEARNNAKKCLSIFDASKDTYRQALKANPSEALQVEEDPALPLNIEYRLKELSSLKEHGLISDEEYLTLREKALGL